MKYLEYLPHSSLQRHVKCFWILEREYTPGNPVECVTPDAWIELILNFGAPYVLRAEAMPDREMPPAFLVGLLKKPLLFRSDGTVKIVATRFHAWGVLPFLDIRAATSDTLATTLGREWHDLAAVVEPRVHAGDYEGAVSDVQDFLITRLLTTTFDPKQIQRAAQMLHYQKGQFRVAELADNCSLSIRQLQRQFNDVVGISPKSLARTIRFEEIRKRLMFHPDPSLTELAYEFGYADQAHFIHDFKGLAGRTPGEFAAEMQALQEVFRDHDNVVFLQSPSPGFD